MQIGRHILVLNSGSSPVAQRNMAHGYGRLMSILAALVGWE